MIVIYDEDTVKFDTLGLGVLRDCTEGYVKEEINSSYELELKYPADGVNAEYIKLGNIICTKVNPFESTNRQAFRIYDISKPITGILSVKARHISYDASNIIIMPGSTTEWTDQKITDTITQINDHVRASDDTKSLFKIVPESDLDTKITKTATVTISSPSTLRTSIANQLVTAYEAEAEFNNFTTTIYKQRGNDRNVCLYYGKQITDLEEEKSYSTNCSAIFPYYWKTSSETSSGVNYSYQQLYIDVAVPLYSYNWLYKEDSSSSSGVIGKIKSAITSAIKNYVYEINSASAIPESTDIQAGDLYLWNSYKYVNVSAIKEWELASESSSSVTSSTFINLIKELPVVSTFSSFINTKERMKALQSVFSTYYSLYANCGTDSLNVKEISSYADLPTTTDGMVSKVYYVYKLKEENSNRYKYYIYAINDSSNGTATLCNLNKTNITMYGDDSFGYKTIGNYTLHNAIYILMSEESDAAAGEVRVYCGYQANTNARYNTLAYLGPSKGTILDTDKNPITFFDMKDGNFQDKAYHHILEYKSIIYISSASDSSYENTLYIPRKADTILDDSSETHNDWPALYYYTEDNSKKYKMYKDNISFDVDSSCVYTKDTWVKIATVKGIDPAYPSASGSTSTKVEKVTLEDNGTFYTEDPYTENGDIISYSSQLDRYDPETGNFSIKNCQTNNLSKNDARVFYDSSKTIGSSSITYYIFRAGQVKAITKVNEVSSLPTNNIDSTVLYKKANKDGTYSYSFRESGNTEVSNRDHWVTLTLTGISNKNIFIYTISNDSIQYYGLFNEAFTQIYLTDEYSTDKPYYILRKISKQPDKETEPEYYNLINDTYKGCIFLNLDNYKLNNITVYPVDVTSVIDALDDNPFEDYDLTSTKIDVTKETATKLLEYLKDKYINVEGNNPNKVTNSTTLTYMHIYDNTELMDAINLNTVLIGDTIHIFAKKYGIKSDLRVTAYSYDIINNSYNDITLGEATETLESQVVSTSDGVSVLANDSGYATSGEVNKIIAKNINANHIATESFEATYATIDSLIANTATIQELTAVSAEISTLKSESIPGELEDDYESTSGNIVTSVEYLSFADSKISYKSKISYSWDIDTQTLTINLK